jgi:hypothetical protein
MSLLHTGIGWAIVLAFASLWLWGLGVLLFRRGPGRWFWRIVAFVQVTLILQGIAGVVLLILGGSATPLHYVYGVIFPVLVLLVAHVLGREQFADRPWIPFSLASFFCFGLTLRALMTGLGYP